VFRAVAAGIALFRHEKPSDTFRGWLRTVFQSKLVNCINAKKRQPTADGGTAALERLNQVAESHNDEKTEQAVESELYHRAMSLIETEFAETTWQAFWLMTVDDLTASDAAARLDISVGRPHGPLASASPPTPRIGRCGVNLGI